MKLRCQWRLLCELVELEPEIRRMDRAKGRDARVCILILFRTHRGHACLVLKSTFRDLVKTYESAVSVKAREAHPQTV